MAAVNVGRTMAALPEGYARLIRLMQTLNFGRVTFVVRSGTPDFTRAFRTARTVKLPAGDNGPRPEAGSTDFELRKEVISLRDQVAKAADGARATVEVKYGLPFIIEIEQEHRA